MAELRSVPSTAQIYAGHTWIPNGEMLHSGTKEDGNRTPCPTPLVEQPQNRGAEDPKGHGMNTGGSQDPMSHPGAGCNI